MTATLPRSGSLRDRPVLALVLLTLCAALCSPPAAVLAQDAGASGVDLAGAELSVPVNMSATPLRLTTSLQEGTEVRVTLSGVSETVVVGEDGAFTTATLKLGGGVNQVTLNAAGQSREVRVPTLPGWTSILPPLLAVILALIFKDVLVALFLGILFGAMMIESWHPGAAFARTIDTYIVNSLTDASHISVLLFTSLLGGMVGVVTKSGGTQGIVERLRPWATSRRRGQIATWFMGLAIFFDDYANTLIVGPTMRPITDRLKISREKLAYIVDSTAAPVVCLFPISTWVGFEIGLIGDAFEKLGLEADAYGAFLSSIPYRFYPFFAITLVLMLAITRFDFGAMRRAEMRAMNEGKVLGDDARPIADYASQGIQPSTDSPKRALNALVPIATVVLVTLFGLWQTGSQALAEKGEPAAEGFWLGIRQLLQGADSYVALLWASLAGALVALVLPLFQRIFRVEEGVSALVAGIKSMLLALLVLTMAWSLSAVCEGLSTAHYLSGLAQGNLEPHLLPALTFVLAAAVAFATGSSWGTLGIMEPLIIPIAHALSVDAGYSFGDPVYQVAMMGSIGAVLTGAVWGDHCSPISDTTILSSMASGCDHVAHVRTQLPYALTTGAMAIFVGAVPAAYGAPAWSMLLLGIAMICVGVVFFSRRQRASEEAGEPAVG
ncbi:MAG: Na+/H+ antiporter NhaC family protein [Thermoanaerobaculia bacterium]|nr:Na+/H+ antiporter NhaC family protein [Thermoanaerobaculia bacterium]